MLLGFKKYCFFSQTLLAERKEKKNQIFCYLRRKFTRKKLPEIKVVNLREKAQIFPQYKDINLHKITQIFPGNKVENLQEKNSNIPRE